MQSIRSLVVPVLVAVFGLALTGCQGPSYVNIPAENGDLAFNNPNGRTVRAVVVAAVDGVITQTPLDGPVALGLPPKAEVLTYESIADSVTSNVVPFPEGEDAAAPTTATLTVTQVRVRGHKGEVDAIRAPAGGAEQLVTVYTAWDAFGGWRVTRIRPWRIPVPDQPL